MPRFVIITLSLIVAILIGVVIWWAVVSQPAAAPTPVSNTDTATQDSTGRAVETPDMTIVFTNDGFERQSYGVAVGETLLVRNDSSMVIEFASDEHPTHLDNPELNLRALQPGESATVQPKTAGTWGIHDHLHPEFTTSVIVTE